MRLNGPVAKIRRLRTVAAQPQAIWDVLADFGAISAWAADVDHSCLLSPQVQEIGLTTTRRVQVGRNALVERITEFEPPHALAYDVEGFPSWLRVNNRWTLTPSADATAVTLASTVTAGGPLGRIVELVVSRVSAKMLDALLTGLADRTEVRYA
ncbi:SRPBCC family protein [Mycolicibacterium sarraceniae]|uniref:MxaD family protein n=1 Tax=Mycolicibacterium sarraceniae TaxID=1534348 RepID=A0A7I7SQZ5_9MYCO|nr:SRPBCC family protein [Mycolicibacterium sarraceniae]BBY58811.1 MxaD family protein [Mycolicibacterium sarraceniae]